VTILDDHVISYQGHLYYYVQYRVLDGVEVWDSVLKLIGRGEGFEKQLYVWIQSGEYEKSSKGKQVKPFIRRAVRYIIICSH
jgi:hypothetical protein